MSAVKPLGRQEERATRTPTRWLPHVAFVITLAIFFGLYADTFKSLISIWASTGRYQYAFLIFPVSAVLVWLRRDDLKRLAAIPTPLGLVPLVFLCLIWLVGAAAHINVATQFSIVAMVPCLVFMFYGAAITRTLMFPLAYLAFAIPFGNFLVGPLQDITARLSVAALQWTPVPVLLDGRFIMTPAGTWHVAEACSGVSFFFATTAFGVLYAYLFFRSWRRRLLFVALALITPIIANGLRVFFTILIGEYFGMHYATGTDHMIFGWQFFGTVLVLLFLVGWPWHEPEAAVSVPEVSHGSICHRTLNWLGVVTATIVALLLLGAPPVWMAVNTSSATTLRVQALALPQTIGNLERARSKAVDSTTAPGTQFRNPDGFSRARYGVGPNSVKVITATYRTGVGPGDEMVAFGNRLFDSSVWKVAGDRDTSVGAFHELRLARQHGQGQWILWYFYRVGNKTATSTGAVKLWQAWNRILGRAVSTQVVTLSTAVSDNDEAARSRLKMAAEELLHRLHSNNRVAG